MNGARLEFRCRSCASEGSLDGGKKVAIVRGSRHLALGRDIRRRHGHGSS